MEKLLPPKNTEEVLQITTALNLLNAIVKLQEGKVLTSYHYIKGMVACLFVWILHHPIDGVALDWDEKENVTYICIGDLQLSFHRVPLVRHYVKMYDRVGLTPQVWDGMQRQSIAAELFYKAMGKHLPDVSDEEADELVRKMRHCNIKKIIRRMNELEGIPPYIVVEQPMATAHEEASNKSEKKRQCRLKRLRRLRKFVERNLPDANHPIRKYGEWKGEASQWQNTGKDYLYKLTLALKWNGWWEEKFSIARKGDRHIYNIVAYTGFNYSHLINALIGKRPLRYIRPETFMRRGWHYFLRRDNWAWTHMTYTRYLLLTAHYNYLLTGNRFYNLCITYGIARYLACEYPQLRFLNVLNFTRMTVRRKVYSAKDLQRVGLQSKSRQLKVWMVVDPLLILGNFRIEDLPQSLLDEYRMAEDYYTFFAKEWIHGKVGLVAYSRFHILPAIYQDIKICGHYAHVMNTNKKWAVYSLMEEEFETDFLFDEIYFDSQLYLVVGCIGEKRIILHDMFNPV